MIIDAYIQARMESSRLPGKSNFKFGEKTTLEHTIGQVKKLKDIRKIVLLTSPNEADNVLEEVAIKNGIECDRCDPVIDRFINACKKNNPDWFIRVCADSIFMDVELNNTLIDCISGVGSSFDYIAYNDTKYPSIMGLFCEAVRTEPFIKRYNAILEHVTYQMYDHSNYLYLNKPLELKETYFRATLDTQDDFVFMNTIYCTFGRTPTWRELLAEVKKNHVYRIEDER